MAIPKNSVIIIFHKEAWSPLLRVDTMDEVKLIRNTERRSQYKFVTRVLVSSSALAKTNQYPKLDASHHLGDGRGSVHNQEGLCTAKLSFNTRSSTGKSGTSTSSHTLISRWAASNWSVSSQPDFYVKHLFLNGFFLLLHFQFINSLDYSPHYGLLKHEQSGKCLKVSFVNDFIRKRLH